MLRIISFSFAIFVSLASEANAGTSGCEWSGCQHFTKGTCGTGLTGGSGRHSYMKSKSCEVIGKKDYCCDLECGWRAPGVTCEQLNQDSYTHEVGSSNSGQQFCCPSNARPNNGFRTNDNDAGNVNEGSGFRSTNGDGSIGSDSTGGFRSSNTGDGSNTDSGFRSSDADGGFRSSNADGGFRSSNADGGFGSTNETGEVTSASSGGFRSG